MGIRPLIGPNGDIPILIRDDDTNFFTKPEMIKSIYSKAWENGFKVSLSAIPLQKGINDPCVPPEQRGSGLFYSIGDNHSLIKYLKEKIQQGSVEILQHGVDHSYNDSHRGEFAGNSNTMEMVLKGRTILFEAFGTEPMFFVPPGEYISQKNIDLISHTGMTPIYRNTIFDTFLRYSYFPLIIKDLALKLIKIGNLFCFGKTNLPIMKPVNIKLNNCQISWSLRVDKLITLASSNASSELTEYILNNSDKYRSPVCILNHYHSYFYDWDSTITKNESFKTLNNILKSFSELTIGWKIDFGTLLERYKKIKNVNIVKTGSKITIQSKEEVRDYSFHTSIDLEQSTSGSLDKNTRVFTIKQIIPQKPIILHEKT